jgi:hypothetical protein
MDLKANAAPERLYISKTIYSTYLYQIPDPDDETAVEYIRVDAFIEKAATWIANRYQANGSYLCANDIEDFEKYMRGE